MLELTKLENCRKSKHFTNFGWQQKSKLFFQKMFIRSICFETKSRNYISLDEKSRIVYVGSINKE